MSFQQVIFITENGDAKIDIQNVKQALSGMGKEELMKYANDPFWVRLRWILFIGFWVIWFGMLGGAIAIIAMAPKCAAPVPKTWWETSPIVQLEMRDLEIRDTVAVGVLLDNLKSQHITTMSLGSIFKGTPGHIIDFNDVNGKIGELQFIDKMIAATKERDQRIVLELDPNYSDINHPWFVASVKKEEPYTNYYIWADGKTKDGSRLPPNNWLSIVGGSAWTWNNQRKQYYLHQWNETQPDFNFHNTNVVHEFNEIFKFWLKRGISGFRIGTTQYLVEDPNLQDEQRSTIPADSNEYQYLVHVHTKDREENAGILKQWREVVSNFTNGDGLFSLRDDIGLDTLAVFNQARRLIDLPQRSQFLTTTNSNITAKTLHAGFNDWISGVNVSWPGWNVSHLYFIRAIFFILNFKKKKKIIN